MPRGEDDGKGIVGMKGVSKVGEGEEKKREWERKK